MRTTRATRCSPIYLHSLEELQGVTRPIKTHATVLITDDLKG